MVVVVVRFEEFNLKFNKVRDPHSTTAGATTAEKLEGTSDGVDPLPFLPPLLPVSHYCSTHVSPIPTLLSSPFIFS